MRMSPDTDKSIRCTVSSCSCVCFKPGSDQLRSCDHCGHGWVAHALEKLQVQPQSSCGPVEVALPGLVLDLSSLVLYGAQAVPVRLKILLDRLYSILSPEQVGHILQSLGWSLGDYVRGYMLQRPGAEKVLDHWLMVTPDEELLILKQFLRFGETRPIVQLMALQSSEADPELDSCPSNTGTRVMLGDPAADPHPGARVRHFEEHSPADPVPHLETCPAGLSVLLPVHFSSSSLHSLVSPSKEFVPSSKLFPCLRRPAGTKLCDRQRHGGRRQEVTEEETPVKIKADPDRTNPPRSLWQEAPLFYHRGASSQESSSSSSLLYQPSSSSSSPHPKTTPKVHGSPSSFLHPLPSFSSFLCPLPSSSFSSSLRPLGPSSSSAFPPSSALCSLPSPSPAGGRKGRVCCGVCGKSFYDKGTLKIHYNAVHLKIKHRCTVTGCTMVFSSLRSRNRHSANPNPRLHTAGGGGGRDSQQHTHTHQARPEAAVWQQVDHEAHKHAASGHTAGCHSNADALTHSPPSPHPVWSHDPTAGLPPPPPPPLHAASSLGSPPSFSPPAFPAADENKRSRHHTMTTCDCDGEPPANQQCRWTSADTLSKKKPRKSSMPVKIEREERRRRTEEEAD